MELKLLPKSVQDTLRSGINITSTTQCVNELIFNSLDAQSTAIAIRINLMTYRIQVVDNGVGISFENFQHVGTGYMTSKCTSRSDLLEKPHFFGFRGEVLASIAEISKSVTIESRCKNEEDTYMKILKKNGSNKVTTVKPRPDYGTTVTVEGFLDAYPIRQRGIKAGVDSEQIKKAVECISLVYPKVTFSIRDDSTQKIILKLNESASIVDRIWELFPEVNREEFEMFSVSDSKRGKITVKGLIYKLAHSNSEIQFIYVNKRYICATKLQNVINKLFAKRDKAMDDIFTKNSHPAYIFDIKCARSDVDLIYEPSKTTALFKRYEAVVYCIEKGFSQVWDIKEKKSILPKETEIKACKEIVSCSQMLGAVKSLPAKRRYEEIDIYKTETESVNNETSGKKLIMDRFLQSSKIYHETQQRENMEAKSVTSHYFMKEIDKDRTTMLSINITEKTFEPKGFNFFDSDIFNYETQENTKLNAASRRKKRTTSKCIQTSFMQKREKPFELNITFGDELVIAENESIDSRYGKRSKNVTYYSHHYKKSDLVIMKKRREAAYKSGRMKKLRAPEKVKSIQIEDINPQKLEKSEQILPNTQTTNKPKINIIQNLCLKKPDNKQPLTPNTIFPSNTQIITEDFQTNKLQLEKAKTCSVTTETQKPKPEATITSNNEWIKQISNFGPSYYINQRTGMAICVTPKDEPNFQFKSRLEFVPKGQSPILVGKPVVEGSMSPASKKSLEAAILQCYKDDCETVKWEGLLDGNVDKNNFLREIFLEKTKQFQDFVPRMQENLLNVEMQFEKEVLKEVEVMCQVDKKFICAVIKGVDLLVLFDQHAVDERIRLERLLTDYGETGEDNKQTYKAALYDEGMKIFLNHNDANLIKAYESVFRQFGLEFEIYDDGVEITKIPVCLLKKSAKNVKAKAEDSLWNLVNGLVFEIINTLRRNEGVFAGSPQIITSVIKMEACRGAIKFGDILAKEKCQNLLESLSTCTLPFQCAHGRPTIAPLLDLKVEEYKPKIHKPKLYKLRI